MREKNRKKIVEFAILFLLCVAVIACDNSGKNTGQNGASPVVSRLPYLGQHEVEFRHDSLGTQVADTVYYTIPKFSFINQNGKLVSYKDYTGKIFIAEFFFAHCETICPIITSQMVRLQRLVAKDSLSGKVMFLSHTVDPVRDLPDSLKAYAMRVGANESNWNFVTGNADDIYWQAQEGYMLAAFPSDTAVGGFFHTDQLALIDGDMHIRGYYDGTSTSSVDRLFQDIKKLLDE